MTAKSSLKTHNFQTQILTSSLREGHCCSFFLILFTFHVLFVPRGEKFLTYFLETYFNKLQGRANRVLQRDEYEIIY